MCILGCLTTSLTSMGFPGGGSDKEHAYQCRRHREAGSIPGLGRSPGGGHGNPLQYSCLDNSKTEERGGLQSIGLQRVRHNWNNLEGMHTGLYQPDAANIRPLPKVVTPTNVSRHCCMSWGQEWWEMANLPLIENHCSSLLSLLWWLFPLGSEKTPWLSATDVLHPAMCLIIAAPPSPISPRLPTPWPSPPPRPDGLQPLWRASYRHAVVLLAESIPYSRLRMIQP